MWLPHISLFHTLPHFSRISVKCAYCVFFAQLGIFSGNFNIICVLCFVTQPPGCQQNGTIHVSGPCGTRCMSVGVTYLDHAGATLYSEQQLRYTMQDLSENIYGNPHSGSECSQCTSELVELVRSRYDCCRYIGMNLKPRSRLLWPLQFKATVRPYVLCLSQYS